jgi:hypothetical protein
VTTTIPGVLSRPVRFVCQFATDAHVDLMADHFPARRQLTVSEKVVDPVVLFESFPVPVIVTV